jgi:hypothetical protein
MLRIFENRELRRIFALMGRCIDKRLEKTVERGAW